MIRSPSRRRAVSCAFFGTLILSCFATIGGCLDRPVAPATPHVMARVVEQVKQNKVSKIDLLFMIDNSSSMADKQSILGEAVPELVKRLIDPKCVDPKTLRTVGDAVDGMCAKGILDFEPVKDIHIGIISSSLGAHGAGNGICDDPSDAGNGRSDPHNNDRGHLIARGPGDTNVVTFENKGFLFYNPGAAGGLATVNQVVEPFKSMVLGVGQHGCGYEASLEAVYRFLIDPDPYDTLSINGTIGGYGQAVLNGTDQALLKQRADFLRPDSLVSVMIVTDENDCSIHDGGQGFYALEPPKNNLSIVARGTSACLANPNDRCCFNCGAIDPPANCPDARQDPECMKGPLTSNEDPQNLRCFNQKQKYGMDFLYPVERYIDGFTKGQIPDRKGNVVANPLYADLTCKPGTECRSGRTTDLVFVAGITGVPWQDIANDPTDLKQGYKTAREIAEQNIWATIVGDPQNPQGPIAPRDPHMIESIKPRPGLPGPESSATADIIHGHDWDPSKDTFPNADLQYACAFPLSPPKTCMTTEDCDCAGTDVADRKNPLCQDIRTNAYSNTQARAKAYPGIRILQLLKGLPADQAIVASICPSNVNPAQKSSDDYGYTPAIHALLGRLRTVLRGRCLPRTLEVDPDSGKVKCIVVEAFTTNAACECNSLPGRKKAADDIVTPDIRKEGNCFCEIEQLEDPGQTLCKTNADPGPNAGNGWCYIDPLQGKDGAADLAQCPLVEKCPATDRRLIKFVNSTSEPRAAATAFIMCEEKTFAASGGNAVNDPCSRP